ncbi:MAG: hypothetical protein C0407_10335 [Desulfobacca sp.]|nr:hypothetical protein [Desulfobacca sp.]
MGLFQQPVKKQDSFMKLSRVITLIAVFLILGFILFVVNQTNQVVQLANSLNSSLGMMVLYGLLIFYALVILVPLVLFLRLPRSLKPPESEQSPYFQTYLISFGRRLASNSLLKGLPLDFSKREQIEEALLILNARADEAIKNAASMVFVSTAISQSGRLDALAVLAAQVRLIWQVAHLFNQRPSIREMLQLYANVGATTFLAMELDDLDVSEQIEPIITNVAGTSFAGAIPGIKIVASIITNSLLDGTANAFLTLRIGIITKQYCRSLVRVEPKSIRRLASVEAAHMLGAIVLTSSKKVTNAILKAAKKKTTGLTKAALLRFKGKDENTCSEKDPVS